MIDDGASRLPRLVEVGSETLARANYHTGFSRFVPDTANAVLAYHAVGSPGRFGNVSPARLRRDLEYLVSNFEVVDLPRVLEPGPEKRVALTFDDAYDDFYENALPVVREFGVPVTLFVPVAFVDGGRPDLAYRFVESPSDRERFNDPAVHSRSDVPGPGVMSWDRLRAVAATDLVTVGNHTATHPDLARVTDPETLDEEIRAPRDRLEAELGRPVDRFCFPFGRHCDAARRVVRETHELSVTSRPGLLFDVDRRRPDPHLLPRLRAHEPEHEVRWNLSGLRWRLASAIG
jgi:peptidoglycan/xylan/chitin deacetylase (PgdA/CDA1 family)